MRTLIITGTYKHNDDGSVSYTVAIFGQCNEHPEARFLRELSMTTDIGYNELIRQSKELYCKFYSTNEYNIITIDYLTEVHQ